tara:strand:- start:64 stop:387 length:324 start_codon:yes stop_codon:yes gene_type:complete
MKIKNIINEASKLVSNDREKSYGNKSINHKNIAKLWSAYLDMEVSSHDVAMLMSLLKIARTKSGELCIDNYIDLVGYAAIAGQLASEEKNQLEFDFDNFKVGGTDPD